MESNSNDRNRNLTMVRPLFLCPPACAAASLLPINEHLHARATKAGAVNSNSNCAPLMMMSLHLFHLQLPRAMEAQFARRTMTLSHSFLNHLPSTHQRGFVGFETDAVKGVMLADEVSTVMFLVHVFIGFLSHCNHQSALLHLIERPSSLAM